ncbi:hypothetical protein L6164_034661 [Bauhinia variegata]|uniref:Uncharacterized protein n=1 Tax=Bauhinia variegata TaxID=167791 RepID=A0ACB9KVH0_BAUVA|nr:hypothetical protein L6164_034661 [Bauhinia variegata]
MWRQNPFQGNHDSDQSISDEEELDDVWPENCLSLNASAKNNEELPLPVRLDFLRGSSEQSLAGKVSCSSREKPTGSPLEDEVEMPDFEEGDFSSSPLGVTVANTSDEEVVSEDEGGNVISKVVMGSGSGGLHRHDHTFVRDDQVRNIDEESEARLPLNESASCSAFKAACSSKANRSSDGIWSKGKPKFSLQSLLDKFEHPCVSKGENSIPLEIHRLPEGLEDFDFDTSANSVENSLEDDGGKEKHSGGHLAELALAHQPDQHSMAELFDNLQDKTDLLCGNSRKHSQRRGKRVKLFPEKSTSNTGDRAVDSEDSSEFMDSGSSSDSEIHDRNMKIAFPEKNKQTMADRFQEVLGASYIADDGTHGAVLKPLRAGIFGNLQRVMQKEKERDMDFWKTLPASKLGGIVVKIISRSLDAKLTVCQCLFGKFNENSLDSFKGLKCDGRERTIIFSPRVCNDVDLEVGNLIRIHPPWKEVRVGNDDNIILCTYFSQIL